MLLEVCANSLESALNAEKAGADRIELCTELAVGGVTPSFGLLKSVKEQISIPVNVLIRPRSGDFTYSASEFELMKHNIALCVDMGFNGIVSGVLHADFTIDIERTRELIQAVQGLQFTFHRAFDWVKDAKKALQQLEALGVDTLLSSGQRKSALEGIDLLTELNQDNSNITIMPGSGINANNVQHFQAKGFEAIHLSGVRMHSKLEGQPKVPMNSTHMLSDIALPITSFNRIQEVIKAVK